MNLILLYINYGFKKMFDYLKQESIDKVISAIYEAIKIITHNKSIEDLTIYIEEGLYGEQFPALEELKLAQRILDDIQNIENVLIKNMNQEKKKSYLSILSKSIEALSDKDLNYKLINGTQLLSEIQKIELFPETFIRSPRKFRISKNIKTKFPKGIFNISLEIENLGKEKLKNIVLIDTIPLGYKLDKFNKEIPYVQVGNELQIEIFEIKAGESIIINFTCFGSGDYPRIEPRVNIKGREGSH